MIWVGILNEGSCWAYTASARPARRLMVKAQRAIVADDWIDLLMGFGEKWSNCLPICRHSTVWGCLCPSAANNITRA